MQAKEKASRIEEQVQQLSAKLADTELEKNSLAARNMVLEAALQSARSMVVKVRAADVTLR